MFINAFYIEVTSTRVTLSIQNKLGSGKEKYFYELTQQQF
jgi:hypothetical protein